MPHCLRGIVNRREQAGPKGHEQPEAEAGGHGEGNELPVGIPDLLLAVPRPQHLPHENAHADTHGLIDHTGQISQRGRNIHSGHHIQAAGGIALVHGNHTQRPQQLIGKQGHPGDDDVFQQRPGDCHGGIGPANEGVLSPIAVGPTGNQQQLHIPGDHRRQCRTADAHSRCSEMPENEHIVQHQIDGHRSHTGRHGDKCLAAFL